MLSFLDEDVCRPSGALQALDRGCLAAEVGANSALQLRGALPDNVAQILQIIAGGDAKPTHKVLGRRLQVSIVLHGILLVGSAEVGIGRNRGGAFEALESRLCLGLGVGVEGATSKVLVGRDTLLGAKLGASEVVVVV